MRYILLFLAVIIPNIAYGTTYTNTLLKDIVTTNPIEDCLASEYNDAERETRLVMTYIKGMGSSTASKTLTGTQTFHFGSSTTTITLPAASTIASATVGKEFVLHNTGAGTITVSVPMLNNAAGTITLSGNQSAYLFSDNVSYYQLRNNTEYNHIADSTDPHGATLTQTNLIATNGTITTFAATTANISSTLTVNGVTGIVDGDIPNTITLDNITQITNRSHNSITGTGTYSHTSIDSHIDDTSNPHGASLTQTSATIAGIAAPYIAQTNGTGTGITLATATITTGTVTTLYNTTFSGSVGTFTGTLGVNGISGIADSDIPNTITLDNITQITSRAHDSITGTGTNSHSTIDTHLADTSDPHGVTLTQTNATIAGVAAPYIAQTSGTGTGNVLTNTTLGGTGTISASIALSGNITANSLLITPTELSYINNATSEIQAQITTATGSITNHVHTGADGTAQISHNSVTGTGTNSHATIDTFVASKAQASGLASLDGSSLVVQNPANSTATPTASKIVIADGSGKIADGWLNSTVSLLGQTIAHNSATITGTGTNSHATIDTHLADTSDPHGSSMTQTNISVTTGTVTTLYNTTFSGSTGTFTGTLGVNGISGITDGDIPDGINITKAVTSWASGGTTGTGTMNLAAGSGMSLTPSYNSNGIGTITFTAAGTSSAGGWTLGATQTVTESSTKYGGVLNLNSNWISGDNDAEGIYILASGPVGVGTNTPATALHVIGGITVSGNVDGRDISVDGTTLDSHTTDTTDPHGASLTQTNISVTTGTVTTLYGTTITIGGTATAAGFVGNGSQLTGIDASWSGITGIPTDNGSITVNSAADTMPIRDSDENLFVAGIVGGTTTGALRIPGGTTAQRPGTATVGMLRYNTTTGKVEVYSTSFTVAGGATTTFGTYTIHTFTSSGSFDISGGTMWRAIDAASRASGTITAEILVVAGGGGSGQAGGGAGGMLYYSNALSGTYTVTVGAGGAASTAGNTTSIGTMTVSGGGAGAVGDGVGGNGGSGAGGAGNNNAGGTGIGGQGYAGGSSAGASPWPAGGGGGGGAVGGNASGSTSGNGGVGNQRNISGSDVYYAGGGGGGTAAGGTPGSGGNGGGGAGTTAATGTNGTANTGGGAGGCNRDGGAVGGIGGSGIVIIRYPTL